MSNGLIPPTSVIASWPAPDYIHPVRRGPGLLVVNILFSSLAFILTVLRVYTRAFITATVGLDDVLAVLALVRYWSDLEKEERFTDSAQGIRNCHVYRDIHCRCAIRLGPSSMGCSIRMDPSFAQVPHDFRNNFFGVFDIDQGLLVVVLSSPPWK
jgi:hypothetical protein